MTTDKRQLTGKTILVTRSTEQSSEFSDRLSQAGATVLSFPALEIGPPSSWQALDDSIDRLEEFDWLVLTSANGVSAFFDRLLASGKKPQNLATVKIAVVGKKTARILEQQGLQPDFIPPNFVADALVEYFPESVGGLKILFPRVETGGREVLVKQFVERGAEVVEVAAYESRCPKIIPPEAIDALLRQAVDAITFASSKTVKNFCHLVKERKDISLDGICVASIGPQTSQTCRDLLGRVDVEAAEYTMDGLYQALLDLTN
ncbi:MAG: uroporphyrinogen-III synthase [Geitlerinemataceae cyanobacterium]